LISLKAPAFGIVKIGCETYEKDLIIHADGKISKRKKKKSKPFKAQYGHTPLSENELDILEEEKPQVVYVGTGYDGALPITPEAKEILDNYQTVILPTPEAIKKINEDKHKLVAFIHVTC
jgi:hypothetical protein